MGRIGILKRIPVLLFPRSGVLIDLAHQSSFHRLWITVAMRGATHIICQGEAFQRFAMDVVGYSQSHAPVIHNWSATPKLLQIGSQRTISSPNLTPHILFLGWLEENKGVFELLEACQEIVGHHEFVLTVAGRGRAEQRARDYVSRNNELRNRVLFIGWVQDEEKEALLETSDILVLPSWTEGFPNAIIEAMAAKVAVIVSSVGNVPDLITNEQEAILVPPKNTQALKLAIEKLIKDANLRTLISERGYVFARENFSSEMGIAKLTSVIKEAVCENIARSQKV